jgi:ATP-dependent DNA helicase RecG
MTSKNPAFDKLHKILKLEADTGYRDKAMIGGLSQFAARWQQEAGNGDDVKKIADILRTYSQLNPVDPRRMAINEIVQLMGMPVSGVKPTAPPIEPPPEPKIEPIAAAAVEPPPEPSAVPPAAAPIESAPPQQPSQAIEPPPPPPAPIAEQKPIETPKPRPLPEARDEHGNRIGLESPVTVISGIGPALAEKLERLGVKTIRDLLYLFPRRYDDFSNLKPINRLQYGDEVTIMGTVWNAGEKRVRGGASIFQAVISDGSGTLQCTWFNPYVANQIKRGVQIVVSGKVTEYNGRLTFSSPEFELLDNELLNTARIVPVYPLTEGLSNRMLRKFTRRTVDYWSPRISDDLPDSVRNSAGLMSLPTALVQIHFPDSMPALEAAQRRMAFDELFLLQLGLLRQKRQWRSENGRALTIDRALLDKFMQALPYPLTEAQRRVVEDILGDIGTTHPMSRLVQGDVGSGKTVVAAAAMFLAAQSGAQAAIMAPTEILAEQHFKSLSKLCEKVNTQNLPRPLNVRLLTGSTSLADREIILAEIADGRANIVVGTHALIQESVSFNDLALAVIDEQHRFGVAQRAMLRQKGSNPHVLVMTATPIPRTLALTLYGDLDLSVIDQMPPGRQPIETRIVLPAERERAYSFIRAQIEKGRQAFIICPLVEESDKIEAKAAIEEHARLQKHVFPQFTLGLLHGRMKPDDKDAAMRAFANNETQILVSTSVVEVGIDVPNATIIMIEGAERFGLAQLHQFRGRVGRGEHKSYCLLQTDLSAADVTERLKAVEASTDGFVLAEKDLQLRGPGEFFGTRQSGLPDLHMTNVTDARLIDLARREAEKLLVKDPDLSAEEHQPLAQRLKQFWESGAGDLS